MLQKIAGRLQSGSLPGGEVEAPFMAVRALVHGRTSGQSVGLGFLDVKAAFYNVLAEEVLEPLLTAESRRAALAKVGFTEAQQTEF